MTAYPQDQKLFKKFSDVACADLPANPDFNAQTLTVMDFLEKTVENLGGDAESMMAAQGDIHKSWAVGYPQFKVCKMLWFPKLIFFATLQRMFDLLPYFMAEHGAEKTCVEAWKIACTALASVTFNALRNHWNAHVRPKKQAIGNALFIK